MVWTPGRLLVQLASDSRFEELTAEALIDGKFLLAMRRGAESGSILVELRSELFVPGSCVEEVDLEMLMDAIARTKKALIDAT